MSVSEPESAATVASVEDDVAAMLREYEAGRQKIKRFNENYRHRVAGVKRQRRNRG